MINTGKPLVIKVPPTKIRQSLNEISKQLVDKSEELTTEIEKKEYTEMNQVVSAIEVRMAGEAHINTDMVDNFKGGTTSMTIAQSLGADALKLGVLGGLSKIEEVVEDSLVWFKQNLGNALLQLSSKVESLFTNNPTQFTSQSVQGNQFKDSLATLQLQESQQLFDLAANSLFESFKSYTSALGFGALGTAELLSSSAILLAASKNMLSHALASGEKSIIDSAESTVRSVESSIESIEDNSVNAIHEFQSSMMQWIKTANQQNSAKMNDMQIERHH